MDEILKGKVAIVTGAAGGQGSAESAALIAAGAVVILTDLDDAGRATAEALGENAHFIRHDVAVEADWAKVVEFASHEFGGVDILVNNAGVFTPGSLQETTVEAFDLHYRVNQLGVFLGVKTVISAMSPCGGGSIINISSVAGVRGFPDMIAYTSTKWAIQGMTKAMARELAPLGIRVNSVHPGIVQTQMLGNHNPETLAELAKGVPLARIGQPKDISELVLYLASSKSDYITGASIVIDGGISL